MAIDGTIGHTNGTNGANGKTTGYSIPKETRQVFENGILNNPLIGPTLPKEIGESARSVRFEGSERPSIPINWRFAESISALKGLEAAMVNVLLKRKYGLEPQEAVINTLVTFVLAGIILIAHIATMPSCSSCPFFSIRLIQRVIM